MKKQITIIFAIIALSFSAFAQKEKPHVRSGNSSYENGNYEAAAEAYRKGLEANAYSYEANFNLGDALYKQGEYESAAKQFDLLKQPGMDKNQLANVYHNIGNTMMEQQKYQEAVEAYKSALRNNPNDPDTRYNLVYAMEKLKEQEQSDCENPENQDEQQDQENQEQNEDQQEQENQEGEQEQQENQEQQGEEEKQNQQQQNQEQQQQQQGQQQNKISKQEAERILQALQMDEKKLHDAKKKKKMKGQRVRIVKDW